jgi:hypothetical protein
MIYDFPLVQWIASCLNREQLENLIATITKDEPIETLASANHPLLPKMLKEVITKQFSQPDRPVVEIILNAVDAGPGGNEPFTVQVRAKYNRIEVLDHGKSMDLKEILSVLILPFGTEKNQEPSRTYIGRFGIGFFSSLNYCVQNPQKGTVIVRTNMKGEAYEVRFYATSHDTATLRLQLQKRSLKGASGTSVTIRKYFDVAQLENYLRAEVKSIPPPLAGIYFNGRLLNESKGDWRSASTTLTDDAGREFVQTVSLEQILESKIVLTSMGVRVKEFNIPARYGIRILFPSLVNVVTDRGDFVQDGNYYKGVAAAFIALKQMIDISLTKETGLLNRQDYIELLPSLVGALRLRGLEAIPNLKQLEEFLIPDKKYVFLLKQYKRIDKFAFVDEVFSASPQGCAVWGGKYQSYQDFIEQNFKQIESTALNRFVGMMRSGLGSYPNIELLFAHYPEGFEKIETVSLISSQPRTPFMIDEDQKTLYINVEHEYVKGQRNSLKRNLAYAAYLQLPSVAEHFNSRPDYIEKEMLRVSSRVI